MPGGARGHFLTITRPQKWICRLIWQKYLFNVKMAGHCRPPANTFTTATSRPGVYTNCRNQRHLYAENAARFFVWTQHSCFRRFVPGAALEPPRGRSAQFPLFAGSVLLAGCWRGPAPPLTKSSDFVRAGAGPAGSRQSSSQPRPWPALARSHPPAAPHCHSTSEGRVEILA